ncbi:transposase [Bordetella genomosp. 5]|uniref:Transposase IS200-like domain-containing protein n=1 Tax=Bordetella genomosp. 5 TaxID=1395608 RepID=A0A261TEC8_9BORD|nr:transposase [Bordetella genomosp. 5]OZI47988.1 hypothetical protein CAL25_16510 [Bordetella genomosp. 5]
MSPRLARTVVAHVPHHIVQRGHRRQTIFAGDDDYRAYLDDLDEKRQELDVQVHAYCLMTNHVHLLLTPSEPAALAKLMKEVSRRATRRWNVRIGATGTLWESRYKSSAVQTELYLLACIRYIELNPVRAGMVTAAEDYRWSSHRARMGTASMGFLNFHPVYLALGRDEAERRRVYREYIASSCDAEATDRIRTATRSGQPLASEQYSRQLEGALGRKVLVGKRGRPLKGSLTP